MDDYIDSDGKVVSKKRPNPTHNIVDRITSKAYQKPHARCSASGVKAEEGKCVCRMMTMTQRISTRRSMR